jgi:hypothetical protein
MDTVMAQSATVHRHLTLAIITGSRETLEQVALWTRKQTTNPSKVSVRKIRVYLFIERRTT